MSAIATDIFLQDKDLWDLNPYNFISLYPTLIIFHFFKGS